ncbi:MAG: hypothetical protein H0T79_16405 [Deltaproteobacteria bacterium]|nr:hypothetical protein [Deltaproteobacteria bacterium]
MSISSTLATLAMLAPSSTVRHTRTPVVEVRVPSGIVGARAASFALVVGGLALVAPTLAGALAALIALYGFAVLPAHAVAQD